MRKAMGLALMVLPLAACSSTAGDPTMALKAVSSLSGSTYRSVSVDGHELVHGTAIVLSFEDDRMAAQAGCNQLSGTAEVKDGTLRWVGQPIMTMMGCADDKAAQDKWLAGLLSGGMSASTAPKELILTNGDVKIHLQDDANIR